MANVIIADIIMTRSDETYYVVKSRTYEQRYKCESLEETENNLILHGWRKSGQIHRADDVKVNFWHQEEAMVAVWDNDSLPYKYLV